MPAPCVMLVDDQRDIVRLLHSTLQTLGHQMEIVDAPSGEEALLEASRRKIDLLVTDYMLPGISGVELMRKIKARNENLKVIFISGMNERKAREEMLNSGGLAIFDKPIPLADFLDAVERGLGLVRTIFPPETTETTEQHRAGLSDLLANFRHKINAQAIFLINDRGRVLARAGNLFDSSMEVSLLSALMAIFSAGLKVSRIVRQDKPESYYVFRGGDHDLILIPVNSNHALLLAGNDIANPAKILDMVQGMLFVRGDVDNVLQSLGVVPSAAAPSSAAEPAIPIPETKVDEQPEATPIDVDLDHLFSQKVKSADLDSFWNEAVEKHGNIPINPDVISFDEAKKLGLAPGKGTGALIKGTGPLKKK